MGQLVSFESFVNWHREEPALLGRIGSKTRGSKTNINQRRLHPKIKSLHWKHRTNRPLTRSQKAKNLDSESNSRADNSKLKAGHMLMKRISIQILRRKWRKRGGMVLDQFQKESSSQANEEKTGFEWTLLLKNLSAGEKILVDHQQRSQESDRCCKIWSAKKNSWQLKEQNWNKTERTGWEWNRSINTRRIALGTRTSIIPTAPDKKPTATRLSSGLQATEVMGDKTSEPSSSLVTQSQTMNEPSEPTVTARPDVGNTSMWNDMEV